eukprot:scaffold2288_cov131-Skeletonema_menzelii.AAC.3
MAYKPEILAVDEQSNIEKAVVVECEKELDSEDNHNSNNNRLENSTSTTKKHLISLLVFSPH